MGYAITPKWYVHYVAETFFFSYDSTISGSLQNYELNTEYKLFKNFPLGIGIARVGTSIDVDANDWRGSFSDSYRGFLAFGTLYF